MRKLLALFFVAFAFVATSYAQEYRDCVHLKNGSIIKGVIVEQVLGKTLTIETSDGSQFVYDLCDIVKVTKEKIEPAKQERRDDCSRQEPQRRDCRERDGVNYKKDSDKDYNEPISFETPKKKRQSNLKSGYHGFFEVNGGYDFINDANVVFGAMTSHGYQLSPYFYMGVGAEFDFYAIEAASIPVFAHLRTTIINRKVSPYIDLRGGYSFGFCNGLYIDPSVGIRFGFGKHHAGFNIGVGYTIQRTRIQGYVDSSDISGMYLGSNERVYFSTIGYLKTPRLRISFDF